MYSRTPFEEQVINNIESQNICGRIWLAYKLWFILDTLFHLFPQGRANKETSFWSRDQTKSQVTLSPSICDDFENK